MRFITANEIFDGSKFLEQGSVLHISDEGRVLNILNETETGSGRIERFEGILCPGFVNAHCHLELSHMKGWIKEKTGLVNFAKDIITRRNQANADEIQEAVKQADETLHQNGIVAVGDICNGSDTFEQKKESRIAYHSFIELIGLNPAYAGGIFFKGKELAENAAKQNLRHSLAPHAPYSVSPQLMQLISEYNTKHISISSLHNQESAGEDKFFTSGEGNFRELYRFLNIDISWFTPTGISSLQSCLPALSENKKLLLVHDTFTSPGDIDFAESLHEGIYWCLCPNANLYIENRLPDINHLLEKKVKVCLGTDSLASNHELSIVSEVNTLLRRFPSLKLEKALEWSTVAGSRALDLEEELGSFAVGKKPGINLLQRTGTGIRLLQRLA